MTGHISYVLEADNWSIVGSYMGLSECALRLDKVLNEDVKSPGFKAHVQQWTKEHDRNLRIFWTSLCRANAHSNEFRDAPFRRKLLEAMNAYPRWFEASDITTLTAGHDTYDNPEAVACVRRILNNPRVQEHLFPHIRSLTYGDPTSSVEQQPTYFIPEFALLPNLRTVTLNQTVYHDGMGHFITPIDLQYVPQVHTLHINPRTDLCREDLLLVRGINIRSKWQMSDYETDRYFAPPLPPPPPTYWESFVSFLQNIFAWLCSWL